MIGAIFSLQIHVIKYLLASQCMTDLMRLKTHLSSPYAHRYKGLINSSAEKRKTHSFRSRRVTWVAEMYLSWTIVSGSCKSIAALSHLKLEHVSSQHRRATRELLNGLLYRSPRNRSGNYSPSVSGGFLWVTRSWENCSPMKLHW